MMSQETETETETETGRGRGKYKTAIFLLIRGAAMYVTAVLQEW